MRILEALDHPRHAARTILLAGVLLLLSGWVVLAAAQEARPAVDIGGIDHAVVDGQHVILVRLDNLTDEMVTASGLLAVLDSGGLELIRLDVDTGHLLPDGPSVLAVPLPDALEQGSYHVSLTLNVEPDGSVVKSGLRQVRVHSGVDPQVVDGRPAGTMQPGEDDRGFPGWLLLMAGIGLVLIGFVLRWDVIPKRQQKTIPSVSMVRKVRVESKPARRPATIKKLLPPGRDRRA